LLLMYLLRQDIYVSVFLQMKLSSGFRYLVSCVHALNEYAAQFHAGKMALPDVKFPPRSRRDLRCLWINVGDTDFYVVMLTNTLCLNSVTLGEFRLHDSCSFPYTVLHFSLA